MKHMDAKVLELAVRKKVRTLSAAPRIFSRSLSLTFPKKTAGLLPALPVSTALFSIVFPPYSVIAK